MRSTSTCLFLNDGFAHKTVISPFMENPPKESFLLSVHRWSERHQDGVMALFIFCLIFCASLQRDMVFGWVFAILDTTWIMATKKLFDRFLSSKFCASHFTFPKVAIIFILIGIAVVSLSILERSILELFIKDFSPKLDFIYVIFKNGFWIFGAFVTSLVRFTGKNTERNKRLTIEKRDLELRLLRSQINPHFLFNALNNIYSLVYTKNEKAPEVILQLSEMLRYIIDECHADKVLIKKEIQYIQNYIDFQASRTGQANRILFEHRVDSPHILIPPMILQPFVENCFVHSDLSSNSEGYIHIHLSVQNHQLQFTTENSKRSLATLAKKTRESIGIANVKERLQLYYGNDYHLEIQDETSVFRVTLQIYLS